MNSIFNLFEAIYLLYVYTFSLYFAVIFFTIILILVQILWEYKPLATSQEILLKFLFLYIMR
jgi:hypothetical protein